MHGCRETNHSPRSYRTSTGIRIIIIIIVIVTSSKLVCNHAFRGRRQIRDENNNDNDVFFFVFFVSFTFLVQAGRRGSSSVQLRGRGRA